MKAMILAAGRGQRMRPLTDHTPKPLLKAAGRSLIEWQILKLAKAGVSHLVVNNAWLGDQIEQALGDGSAWGVHIQHSAEEVALETAGGIARALPLLGNQPFLVINGDIWCDWPLERAAHIAKSMSETAGTLAHLVLVNNPEHHPNGDFALSDDGLIKPDGESRLTFSGIGIYHPDMFVSLDPDRAAPLAPLLRQAMLQDKVSGEHHRHIWMDIGTPERLQELSKALSDL